MATEFEIRNPIDVSAEDYWPRIFAHADFLPSLYARMEFEFERVAWDPETGLRHTRIVPDVDTPAAIRKALGGPLAIEEIGHFHADGPRYEFRIVPSRASDKIDIRGVMTTEPRPGGCTRVTRFRVDVRIFGLGRIVESFVERSTRERYAASGEFANEFLRTHG